MHYLYLLFCKGQQLVNLCHKEKERKGRFVEIVEKITRKEYTVEDW